MIRLPILDPSADGAVHHNCARCTALCCQYVSTEIDPPTTGRDFDNLRWYLMHPGVRVYCEDDTGSWFLQFMSTCRNLGADNRCGIYETRPQMCRDLDATVCEFALGAGDRHLFTNLEEFDHWMLEREHRRKVREEKRRAVRGRGPSLQRQALSAPRG